MHTCVEGSKRQLPSWMVQKVGTTHVSNSDNVVETHCSKENGEIITSNSTNKDHKRETTRRTSNFNSKCEVKGRRNLSQRNRSSDDIIQKKKKGDRSRDRVRRSSSKKGHNLEDLSHGSDDDMDLTVDDLMAIAKQYVKDYENKEQQEPPSRQCESNWQFPATTESGTTFDSLCENNKSSCSEREALHDSSLTTGESIATGTSQTGHPAQDMLDLFLGPLLRKTLEKEEKSKSILENLEITHELTRKSNDELGGEMVPLMKKRNTLKDKVAMLLD